MLRQQCWDSTCLLSRLVRECSLWDAIQNTRLVIQRLSHPFITLYSQTHTHLSTAGVLDLLWHDTHKLTEWFSNFTRWQVEVKLADGWQAMLPISSRATENNIIIYLCNAFYHVMFAISRWSIAQRVWLLIMRSRVRSTALPQILNVD